MRHSCGAIFYAFDPNGQIGIILGQEQNQNEYLPFKGCMEEGETLVDTAIREIREETGGLIVLKDIVLEHRFTSRRKHYYIGLCEVPYDLIEKYDQYLTNGVEKRKEYVEKRKLKFFHLDEVNSSQEIHNISKSSVNYYMNKLRLIQMQKSSKINNNNIHVEYCRKQSIPQSYLYDDSVNIDNVVIDVNNLLNHHPNPNLVDINLLSGNIYGNKRKNKKNNQYNSNLHNKNKSNINTRYQQLIF